MFKQTTLSKCFVSLILTLFSAYANAQATAGFTVNSTPQCLSSNSFIFTNTSTGSGLTYAWDFGDGTTSSATSPSKVYAAAGYYSVQLVVTQAGLNYYANQTVVVSPKPTVSFNSLAGTFGGNSYTFVSTSTIAFGVMNYFWDFGDGSTSTLINPVHTFANTGTYNVKLRVTSDAGCSDSVTQSMSITLSTLASNFAVTSADTQYLAGNNFTFNNVSTTGGGVTYLWEFGDGTTSTAFNPSHTYSYAGLFTVILNVMQSGFNTAVSSHYVYVLPAPPAASFTISNTANSYSFTNTSTGAVSYYWDLGNGQTSTATNPSNIIYAPGNYTVTLTATSGSGATSTTSQTFTVAAPPSPVTSSFTIGGGNQCVNGNSYSFTNTSSSGLGITYVWDFGDGTTSSIANPTHSYSSAGTFTVTLNVYSSGGSNTSSQTVTVYPKPSAAFSYNNNGLLHNFNSNCSISSGTFTVAWDFGDGSTGTGNSVAHTYASAATYPVKIVATSNNGCADSTTQNVVISNAPNAAFIVNSATTQCLSGNNFSFTNLSTPGGATYLWSFGDGSTSNATNPSHTYTSWGFYNVQLKMTFGGNDYYTNHQVIVKPMPVASFGYSVQSFATNTYNFLNNSTLATGSMSYVWDFSDGSALNTTTNPQHSYPSSSPYTAKLVVTSDAGCKDSTTYVVTPPTTPSAAFSVSSASTQCQNGNSFTFSNTSTGGGLSYAWDFGDGTTSTSATPAHTYTAAGVYSVKLVVTNSAGADSTTQSVTVNPSPVAGYTTSTLVNTCTFTNTSSIGSGSMTYAWDFGDGFTSILTNPVKSFADGSYNVKLVATSNLGCKDSITQTLTFGTAPTAAFTVSSASTQCSHADNFTFSNTSSGTGALTYFWSFGDGTTSTLASPTKSYSAAGTFTITLTVTNAVGSSTTTQNVVVLPGPTVGFSTYSNTSSGSSFTFISTSSVPAGTMTYAWDLGDGSTSTLSNPTHAYAAPGTYTVKLFVTGSGGCTDSASTTVTVCPSVTAGFNVTSSTSQCVSGNSFTFANASTNNAGVPSGSMTYAWDFGDGATSTLENPPAHTYASWGDYNVKLVVTLISGGCTVKDSVIKLKVVSAEPMPSASYILYLDTYLQATALITDTVKRCFHPGYDFSYMSSSTLARGTMDYFWHFGTSALFFRDGDSSHYINPRIVFDTAGIYPVKLVVQSDKGCLDSVTRMVHLSDPHARFNFTIDSTTDVYANPVVTVTDASYDYGGIIVAWNWNFGGGVASSALQNPAPVVFPCGGSHNVILTITSNAGCVVDTVRTIVTRVKPHAFFSISAPNYTPDIYARPTFTFTNSTTVNDACPSMSYNWNFGDGYSSSSANPTHAYKGSGNYTVTLIATNNNGGKKDTTSHSVLVAIYPKAGFSTSQSLTPDVYAMPTVTFTNTSTVTDTATSVAGLGYAWDFGDGFGTSNVANPAPYQYASGGTYTVTLIVTNPVSGLMDTITHNVTVSVKPKAAFSSALDYAGDVYANPDVNFTNGTTANDASASFTYAWDFGDGNASTSTNPTHQYSSGGSYTVTLIATNTNGGLKDTITHNVTVNIKPKAAFSSALDYGGDIYANPDVNFTNGTTANDASASFTYAWDFGDGNTSTATNPSHQYSAGGTYTVTLISTNANGGLMDTVSHNVTITIKPHAILSVHSAIVSTPVPMSIGNADYKVYTITGLSNGVNPSTVAAGTIAHTEITIDSVYIPRSDSAQYAQVNDADATFGIQNDTLANYRFNIRLIVTSDLGEKDTTYAVIGATETGFTAYRSINHNSGRNTVHLPNIGSTGKKITTSTTVPVVKNTETFLVYPNPAKDQITISFTAPENAEIITARIHNYSGKILLQQKQGIGVNITQRQNISMNVSNLSSGLYTVILTDEKGNIIGNTKFIKVRE